MAFNLFTGAFNTEQIFFINNPYVLTLTEVDFVKYEIEALYKKLLFDCLAHSDELPTVKTKTVNKKSTDIDLSPYYDSVIVGEAGSKGLISFLAEAMYAKNKISLVYADEIVRVPDSKEQAQIDNGKTKIGLTCDFGTYTKTDVLKFYFYLLYTGIGALNSQMNISKALQIKISKLRDLIGFKDSNAAKNQAAKISTGLKNGNSVLIDELDKIETMKLDTKPASEAIDLIVSRIAGVIGMPVSYLNGLVTTGLSAAGQGDELIIERGLQNIFNEIFKRVSDRLLGTNLTFKRNVWGLINERLKLLPVVESSTLYDDKTKKEFADKAIHP